MQLPPPSSNNINVIGYVSSFVEIFAWVSTVSAYRALWELLWPSINPYGWGYDFWYDNHALHSVPGHKMAIVSSLRVFHEQNQSITSYSDASGRTDTTAVKDKWKAVLHQEKYYAKFKNISLKIYRTHQRMKNSSWNGPILGYVYPPT